jgi:hypothetical protein
MVMISMSMRNWSRPMRMVTTNHAQEGWLVGEEENVDINSGDKTLTLSDRRPV